MIQAVLFDLDGVIVDTLHYHYLAWKHMFEKRGGIVREHTILLNEGRNSRETLPILMKEAGIHIPTEQEETFIEEKRSYFRSILQAKEYPHAFAVIQEIRKRGYRTALVTGSALKNMQHLLDAGQQSHFEFIITGDEVSRAKPFPDPYISAAEHLGVRPEHCLVVENAPLGIEAAKNAGMYCVAIETTLGKEYLGSADCILQNISDLLQHPFLLKQATDR
jgi:beta-phosphoglucomutase